MNRTKELVWMGLLTALLVAVQVALASLPNVELVTLLIVIYVMELGLRAIWPVMGFILLQGLLYGFGLWWVAYLYIWPILCIAAYCFRRNQSKLFWALFCGGFGLSFGALSTLVYFVVGGIGGGIAYYIAGIPYDLLHCGANFLVTLVLFRPIKNALSIAMHT